jgi:acetyl-CoA carboxylase carboxyl transferase alpha subunit
MAGLPTPIVAVVTGEGGSGGALALAVADRVLMLEHAIYSVISPEGCAAILWEDASRAKDAAEVLRITAPDLHKLGVIDGIIPEPPGGAHRNWAAAARALQSAVVAALGELVPLSPTELVQQRYAKFRRMGIFEET